ncbi:hypothetical protein EGW08_004968 [Elysia chlorotica]|uniref:Ribosomal RNA-processing protein 8 n=1 Tax=Elysia chlorotica TaxID=188477 RepID=A0A433U0L4_ELYCH|nr:hypothetical protein EGW08_004968 [Elysia chlorotica]
MSEFDCDTAWDVDQEADSLNKSLFGGKAKKKRTQKAKQEVSSTLSSIVPDSDDETFTKKGNRKLKEKRRRKKKQDKKTEGDGDEESSLNMGEMQETEPTVTAKIKKTGKKNNEIDSESQSDPAASKVKKSNKRKDITQTDDEELSTSPKKKRKKTEKNEEENDKSMDSAVTTEETPKKKRKRNRKKKNNSKKNKYAHLALNRKVKETDVAVTENSGEKNDSTQTPDEAPQASKQTAKQNDVKSRTKAKKEAAKDVLNESCETSEKATPILNHKSSTKPGKEDVPNANVKKGEKKKKKILDEAQDKAESADPVGVSLETKKIKRKGDTVSTPERKNKAQKVLEELNEINSPIAKKKKRDKLEKVIKNGDNDTEVQAHKNSKTVDPKKVSELQQRQKKLLHALGRAGSSNENLDSKNVKENKKDKKKKSSEVSKEIQSQNTEASKASLKNGVAKSAGKNSDPADKANKKSLEVQSKAKGGDSSSKKGDKFSAMGSLAQEKLSAARFRYLNEQLYTCEGREALKLFREDRDAFHVYHTGFENQAAKWPVNPVNVLIKQIKDKSPSLVIADFGCGDAKLAQALPQKVHSFDLVALNPRVKACDMSSVPLQNESVDIAVFCLSLMGTNLDDYVSEANRVLKTDGLLKIVEVSSRFKGLSPFLASVCSHGFQLLNKRDLSEMFYLMDFKKLKTVKKGAATRSVSLKPCLYKKR